MIHEREGEIHELGVKREQVVVMSMNDYIEHVCIYMYTCHCIVVKLPFVKLLPTCT